MKGSLNDGNVVFFNDIIKTGFNTIKGFYFYYYPNDMQIVLKPFQNTKYLGK